jgi:hypothetical protein
VSSLQGVKVERLESVESRTCSVMYGVMAVFVVGICRCWVRRDRVSNSRAALNVSQWVEPRTYQSNVAARRPPRRPPPTRLLPNAASRAVFTGPNGTATYRQRNVNASPFAAWWAGIAMTQSGAAFQHLSSIHTSRLWMMAVSSQSSPTLSGNSPMKKSPHSKPDQVLPPASTAIATVDELSPEAFLALHGVPVPRRVRVYGSFDAAVRGVIADASKG